METSTETPHVTKSRRTRGWSARNTWKKGPLKEKLVAAINEYNSRPTQGSVAKFAAERKIPDTVFRRYLKDDNFIQHEDGKEGLDAKSQPRSARVTIMLKYLDKDNEKRRKVDISKSLDVPPFSELAYDNSTGCQRIEFDPGSDYDTEKLKWGEPLPPHEESGEPAPREESVPWSIESETKFLIQFLADPYDCVDLHKKNKKQKLYSKKELGENEFGTFNKIAVATGKSRRECAQFFYDNMSKYWFFDVLEDLYQQNDKDASRFKPGEAVPRKKPRKAIKVWENKRMDWKLTLEQFPRRKKFHVYKDRELQYTISATANALLKIGVIAYKNNIPSRPGTDVFEELAESKELKEEELNELKKVRDRELQVLKAKHTRAGKAKRDATQESNALFQKYPTLAQAKEILDMSVKVPAHNPTLAREIMNPSQPQRSPPPQQEQQPLRTTATKPPPGAAAKFRYSGESKRPPEEAHCSKFRDSVAQNTRRKRKKNTLTTSPSDTHVDLTSSPDHDIDSQKDHYTEDDLTTKSWNDGLVDYISECILDKVDSIEVLNSTNAISRSAVGHSAIMPRRVKDKYINLLKKNAIFIPCLMQGHWVLYIVWMANDVEPR